MGEVRLARVRIQCVAYSYLYRALVFSTAATRMSTNMRTSCNEQKGMSYDRLTIEKKLLYEAYESVHFDIN